jgi:capsule polysaccharide export protein KpsE/RkpR
MNANELAEIQAFKTEELTMWERNHTATMLRQQQAEIEALKEALRMKVILNEHVQDSMKEYKELLK